jgi:hypothetical protein
MRPEDYNVDVEYSQLPLMAVKKFRDFIKVYLKKVQIQEYMLPVEIRGISKYFEVHLAGYSEAATMFEQVTQEMSKIRRDLGDPMNVAKLRLVLNALGVESACDRVLMFSEKEGPVCMGKSD